MTRNAWTFIIVPDAKSQCKRYNIPHVVVYILGVTIVTLLVAGGIFLNMMLSTYNAVVTKAEQVEKLKKISVSQKNMLDRYEEDATQLGKNLVQIKQLNARLLVLTGLDPEKGGNNLGLGGPEKKNAKNAPKMDVQDNKNDQE